MSRFDRCCFCTTTVLYVTSIIHQVKIDPLFGVVLLLYVISVLSQNLFGVLLSSVGYVT